MRIDRRELATIFFGGALGTVLRVWLGQTFSGAGTGWPWLTFAINVSGCFVLASIATRLPERRPSPTYRWPLLGPGFCGAYTTFSTMQIEILRLVDEHRYSLAVSYAVASVAAGYAAIWAAAALVRRSRLIS